jgi:glyoxylase-like metal-dependent hydrolase (beta-lactamase superfamily II)
MFEPILLDAHNPGPMTGGGNHTYLLASREGNAALVDAGVGEPRHLADLAAALETTRAQLLQVLVTHGHPDHAAGAPAIAAAHPSAAFAKHPWPGEDARYAVEWQTIGEGDVMTAGGHSLAVLHTPGHAPDHLAFWHEESRTIFAGDLVVAGSSVMIHSSRGGNLVEYLASLERLLALEPRVLLPAHGPCVDDPPGLLRGYLDHRHQREREVIDALRAGRPSVQAIAETIYHGLDAALMPAARENVRAHLGKLESEGRAVEEEAGQWRLTAARSK